MQRSSGSRTCRQISVIDLNYAYGQMKVAPETSKHCNFAITRENQRIIPLHKGILRSSRHTDQLPRENRPNTWSPNISMARWYANCNTRNKRTTHQKRGISPNKIRKRRLQSQQKKSNFNQKGTVWLGRTISEDGIRPNREKTEAINNSEAPTYTNTLKSFPKQYNTSQNLFQTFPKRRMKWENCWKKQQTGNGRKNATRILTT